MKTLMVFILSFLFFSNPAFATIITGTMTEQGDGTYSIEAQDDSGNNYSGEADGEGSDTLDVTLRGNGGSYTGTASQDEDNDDEYDLALQNDSGDQATGTLETDG